MKLEARPWIVYVMISTACTGIMGLEPLGLENDLLEPDFNPLYATKCLVGWEYRALTDRCYRFVDVPTDYPTAAFLCKEMGGTLALPTTYDVTVLIRHIYWFEHSWIGLSSRESKGVFKWENGKRLSGWTNWISIRPKSRGECVIMTKTEKWELKSCTEQYPYTCEMAPLAPDGNCRVERPPENSYVSTKESRIDIRTSITYHCNSGYVDDLGTSERWCLNEGKLSGSPLRCIKDCPDGWTYSRPKMKCLKFKQKLVDYDTATKSCEEMGGTLALPKSEEENILLMKYDTNIWIGSQYRIPEKAFMWADNTPIVWRNFERHALKDRGSKGNCVILQHGYSLFKGFWKLNRCSHLNKYVCQVSIYKLTNQIQNCEFGTPSSVIPSIKSDIVPVGDFVSFSCAEGYMPTNTIINRECLSNGELDGKPLECHRINSCPQGWTQHLSYCYRFYNNYVTFSAAESNCKTQNSLLAMPKTEDENKVVMNVIKSKARNVWIGLDDRSREGTFLWSDKTTLGWQNWNNKEPNNYQNREDCVHVTRRGHWNDNNCQQKYPFVCQTDSSNNPHVTQPPSTPGPPTEPLDLTESPIKECNVEELPDGVISSTNKKTVSLGEIITYSCKPGYSDASGDKERTCQSNGRLSGTVLECITSSQECTRGWQFSTFTQKCYRVYAELLNYKDAFEKCEKLGGTLALPKTSEENKIISDAKGINRVWIGLDDQDEEGKFRWADGDSLEWHNWYKGNANNAKDRDCITMRYSGHWIVDGCNRRFHYMCQITKGVSSSECKITLANNVVSNTQHNSVSLGSTVEFSCVEGYTVLSGDTSRECLGNGQLSGDPLVCIKECPKGWTQSASKCFRFYSNRENYSQAKNKCKSLNGFLSMPKSEEDSNEIYKVKGSNMQIWIGLDDMSKEGVYRWNDGSIWKESNWDNWRDGEPDNWQDSEDCVIMAKTGIWKDNKCSNRNPYVCEISPDDSDSECKVEAPINGVMSVEGNTVKVGVIVEFSCAEGFTISSGDTKRECLGNGMLDGLPLVCKKGCPKGWTQSDNNQCLRHYSDRVDYNTAKGRCESLNGKLSMPKTEEENDHMHVVRAPKAQIWIGLDDIAKEGVYRWNDGNILKDIDWTNWKPGEPDNWKDSEDCIIMAKSGVWKDSRCTNRNSYICQRSAEDTVSECSVEAPLNGVKSVERDTVSVGDSVQFSCNKCYVAQSGDTTRECLITGKLSGNPLVCQKICPNGWTTMQSSQVCYRLFKKAVPFNTAQGECVKERGSLAIPKSEAEYNELLKARYAGSRVWIGLNDLEEEGNFKWVDGTRLRWSNWKSNQPNNERGNQHCVHMISSGEWMDNNCSRLYWFLCQLAMSDISEDQCN